MRSLHFITASLLLSFNPLAYAAQMHATMHEVNASAVGKEAGKVKAKDTAQGLEIHVELEGLTPGQHGFHMHKNASCDPAAKEGERQPPGEPDRTLIRPTPVSTKGQLATDIRVTCRY